MPISPVSDESTGAAGIEPDAPSPETEPAQTAESQLAELREELARLQDRYRRALADLDNFRKRMQHEGDRRAAAARDGQLREWLEALDSVERALQMEPGDPGLTAVLQQMETILSRHGIERIASVGEPFDPSRHDAIAVQPSTEVPDRSILAVARSGFGHPGGEVLRTAQVVVAQQPHAAEDDA